MASLSSMESFPESEKLLDGPSSTGTSELEDFNSLNESRIRRREQRKLLITQILCAFLFCLLILTNLGWFWHVYPVKIFKTQQSAYLGPNEWIGTEFSHDWAGLTNYEDGNKTHYADEEWEGYFPRGAGVVSVTKAFAAKHNLEPAAVAPEDPEKMIYMMAGFHQMHCLMVVRETVYQLNGTSSSTDPILWDHVLHCIDAVRQALVCFNDPTLINLTPQWPGIPNGQLHMCRNKQVMYDWAVENWHDMPVDPNNEDGLVDVSSVPAKPGHHHAVGFLPKPTEHHHNP